MRGDVDWGDYEVFDPGVDDPLGQLPRREARAAFDHLMSEKDHRVSEVRALVGRNGVDLECLSDLNGWFAGSVEENPDVPGRLANIWYSVVNDIGLYLGDLVISRSCGQLRWEMFTAGKKDISYQRHVVRGFDVANPKYYVDFDLLVGMYGHRVVRGEKAEPDFFKALVDSAIEKT